MVVRADVTCFLCGHVAGWIEGDDATPSLHHAFHLSTGRDRRALRPHGRLRCPRCDGPVFFEAAGPASAHSRVEVPAADIAGVAFASIAS